MNSLLSLAARFYSVLLRTFLPALSGEFASEALATFRELGRDARDAGPKSFLAFLGRELSSLFRAAAGARKESRKAKGGRGGEPADPDPRSSGRVDPSRSPRVPVIFDTLRQDIRYAVRNLARSPGFVTVSVLSLTFGIAVSTALFSVVNAVVLRPLPHASEPEELVRIFTGSRRISRGPMAFPDYLDLKAMSETVEGLAVVSGRNFNIGFTPAATRQLPGLEVSEDYFEVVGIPMIRGRGFLEEDVEAGGRVAVIGFNLWQQEFEGDPDVLGKTLLVDGHVHSIVGVGPEGMVSLSGPALLELVVPIIENRDDRGRLAYTGVARMREGVSPLQVQAEMDALAQHLAERLGGGLALGAVGA